MRYIDAEKLIAEIERRISIKENLSQRPEMSDIKESLQDIIGAYQSLKSFITSLQQEPRFPQYDNIVDKVFGAGNLEDFEYREAEMLVALTKEELLKSLQQEQPEVDLEKEIKDKYSRYTSTLKTRAQYAKIARHFYELGLNARKEE